jgi:hypothetical protein
MEPYKGKVRTFHVLMSWKLNGELTLGPGLKQGIKHYLALFWRKVHVHWKSFSSVPINIKTI